MRLSLLNETGPQLKTLKNNQVKLSDDERAEAKAAGASIKKAVVRGKTYFYSNTHRCYAVATSLDKAIEDYFSTVEPSG